MQVTRLSIEGAYVFSPVVHADDRGSFHEWFRDDVFRETTGHSLSVAQANSSVSAAGTIRGVHFADLPPGQAKYVFCASGTVFDVVVDIRLGSPTFGQWESVYLGPDTGQIVYLSEGLGHAFMAIQDQSVVNYLCSAPYSPAREHTIHPLDRDIGIDWPTVDNAGRALATQMSHRDSTAPSLAEAHRAGLLPSIEGTREWVRALQRATSKSQ